jgi:hypothetical protein
MITAAPLHEDWRPRVPCPRSFVRLVEDQLERTWHDDLEPWGLTPDAEPIITPTSRLLCVRTRHAQGLCP